MNERKKDDDNNSIDNNDNSHDGDDSHNSESDDGEDDDDDDDDDDDGDDVVDDDTERHSSIIFVNDVLTARETVWNLCCQMTSKTVRCSVHSFLFVLCELLRKEHADNATHDNLTAADMTPVALDVSES